jgi:hypothetical protein
MKNEITDEKLKTLFGEMRSKDASDAPDFGKLVQCSETTIRKFAPWRIAAAMAIVIILGLVASLMITSSNRTINTDKIVQVTTATQETWPSISDWQASTDNLFASNSIQSNSSFSTSTDTLLDFSTSYNQ